MTCGPHCAECPLKGKADPQDIQGPERPRFIVVTDVPNHRPEAYGRLLSKSAAGLIAKNMTEEGFVKADFAFVPQVRCPYDPDKYTTKERTKIQKSCRPYLMETLRYERPEAVLPLGAEAAKQVLGHSVQITKVRGQPTRTEELGRATVVLPLLSPLMVVLYPQHASTFAADCATLGRLVDHGYDIKKASNAALGSYEMIDDLQFLIDEKPNIVSYDTENTGLRWYAKDAKLLTMQFSIEEGKAYLLPWDHPDAPQSPRAKRRLRQQLVDLLCPPKRTVIGQNAKYDAVYTAANAGVRYRIGGDTLMLATLLDENATTKNLDDLTKRYVPRMAGYADSFNATVDKSKMIELPLNQKFVDYGCGDADASLSVYNVIYPMVASDPKLLAHYNRVTLPGLNAFASVELRGLHVNEEQADVFEGVMAAKVEELYTSLLSQVPKSIKRKHLQEASEKAKGKPVEPRDVLSFGKKGFLLDILFYHPDGLCLKPKAFTKTTARLEESRRVPSTSTKDHLPYFYDTDPFTFELAEYIKTERILNTNIRGFKKKYIIDGMVRSVYNLHVAVTGRTSSEDPNGQNIPKRGPVAKAYREMFIAPPGHFLLEADLSQAELRIAGDMANDPTMIKIYREKGDIHTYTACIVMGVSMEAFKLLDKAVQKDARTKAKAVNFGFLYGMGWRKFIAYAKTQYGVEFSEKEAQRIRKAFFERYFKLPEWHKMMREFARKHKFVRSYDGRIRHLPMIDSPDEMTQQEAERQAINSPVQEFGSSLGVMACGRMDEEIDPSYLQLVGFVHDAIYCYVPMEYLEWGAKTLKHYMQSNPLKEWFGREMKVPIVADVGFGVNFSQVYEMGEFDEKEPKVGVYNFGKLFEEDPDSGLFIPEQRIPPNRGRRVESAYGLV